MLVLLCASACGDNIRFYDDAQGAPDARVVDGSPNDGSPDGSADAAIDATIAEAPVVVSTIPAPSATNVPRTTLISATFDMAMAGATITDITFRVRQGNTPVAGAVTLLSPLTASFDPDRALIPGRLYTATVTTGVTSLEGTALAMDHSWTFTVAAAPVPPRVISTIPAPLATNVPRTTLISATFDMPMAGATFTNTTFFVRQGNTPVAGAVTLLSPLTASFDPDLALIPGRVYTATITTGVTSLEGTALAMNHSWTFTVAPAPVPPRVISTTPPDGTIEVSVNKRPTATFSKAMNPLTINDQSFLLTRGAVLVPGTVRLDTMTNTAEFTPDAPLAPGVLYTGTITTAARDTSGTPLASAFTWTFTTGACSLESVPLRTAARFGVLAASTVTSTGPTVVTGDVGVSPGTAVVGFPPGLVIGAIQAGNPIAAQGSADLTAAYLDAASRVLCPITVAGNLGGMTLPPGLYKSTSSLAISSGDLTLDAQGDPDAVFIFQTASTLTATSGRSIILAGGARASNIFWQVGTSATLGTTSVFYGNVMALAAITLGTGARLDGRALARTAAVALDSNIIVAP